MSRLLHVKDLREAARTQTPQQFCAQLGAFVLVQRPTGTVYQELAKLLRRGDTVAMAHELRLPQEILSMLQAFENLLVLPLNTLEKKGELVVGRADDCDVVIHEPSVSSRHAMLKWKQESQQCALIDLDSRNGTFLNARRLPARESYLADGDAISFGDAQFLFFRAEALQEQIKSFHGKS
ncbi:MAG: FHA domain-containing protein [Myxococcota bacterium]